MVTGSKNCILQSIHSIVVTVQTAALSDQMCWLISQVAVG